MEKKIKIIKIQLVIKFIQGYWTNWKQ
jgi:hypothetical protein